MADQPPARTLDDALRWLDAMERCPAPLSTGAWPLGSVLEHLAQSIEFSLHGFPQPKPALFQHTVGRLAWAVFRSRGRMNHGLAEPIPGAPALTAGPDWRTGAARLRAAIAAFQAHDGPMAPHFAYGAMDKADYAQAHALHIANHQDEIVLGDAR